MKALKEILHTPLTHHERTQGIVILQYIQNTLWDGTCIPLRNGAEMAYLIRALQTMKSQRILNRRFDLNAVEDRGGPVSFVPTLQDGAPGAAGERIMLGRTARDWSRDKLSQRSGVASITIFKIEHGQSQGLPKTLKALRGTLEEAGVVFAPDLVSWTPPVAAAPVPDTEDAKAEDHEPAYSDADAGGAWHDDEPYQHSHDEDIEAPYGGHLTIVEVETRTTLAERCGIAPDAPEYDEAAAAAEWGGDEPDYADPAPLDENDPANWIMIGSDADSPGDNDEEPI
jgi:transcriptional regulator with XRE-family HTH domain